MGKGRKYDQEKPRWELVELDILTPMVRVLTRGARKYEDGNWKRVPDRRRRYFAALLRHLAAWEAGEKNDPEWNESHLAHAMCCLLFLSWDEQQADGKPNRTAFDVGRKEKREERHPLLEVRGKVKRVKPAKKGVKSPGWVQPIYDPRSNTLRSRS